MDKHERLCYYAVLPVLWLVLSWLVPDSFYSAQMILLNLVPIWWLSLLHRFIGFQVPIPVFYIVGFLEILMLGFLMRKLEIRIHKFSHYFAVAAFTLWLAFLPQAIVNPDPAMPHEFHFMTLSCICFCIFVVPFALVTSKWLKNAWRENRISNLCFIDI